jgi:hypothetical protein
VVAADRSGADWVGWSVDMAACTSELGQGSVVADGL